MFGRRKKKIIPDHHISNQIWLYDRISKAILAKDHELLNVLINNQLPDVYPSKVECFVYATQELKANGLLVDKDFLLHLISHLDDSYFRQMILNATEKNIRANPILAGELNRLMRAYKMNYDQATLCRTIIQDENEMDKLEGLDEEARLYILQVLCEEKHKTYLDSSKQYHKHRALSFNNAATGATSLKDFKSLLAYQGKLLDRQEPGNKRHNDKHQRPYRNRKEDTFTDFVKKLSMKV